MVDREVFREIPEIPIPIGPENGPFTATDFIAARRRGVCGGVRMALEGTRQALSLANGKILIYTNRDVVNNRPVMEELTEAGLVNIRNDWNQVPDGSVVLFSAHGIPPAFREIAQEKDLLTIDLTCQLVRRVHRSAIEAEKEGKHILYAGVEGHPETVGVMGEIKPENITLIQNLDDAKKFVLPEGRIAILLSQTTLSTAELLEIYKFFAENPQIEIPNRWDICPATDLNQKAVNELIRDYGIDFLMVQGSLGSHNSSELKKIAETARIPSVMIDSADQIDRRWFTGGIRRVGFSAGASVEDKFSDPVFDWFRNEGIEPLDLSVGVKREKQFILPETDLRRLEERQRSLHG